MDSFKVIKYLSDEEIALLKEEDVLFTYTPRTKKNQEEFKAVLMFDYHLHVEFDMTRKDYLKLAVEHNWPPVKDFPKQFRAKKKVQCSKGLVKKGYGAGIKTFYRIEMMLNGTKTGVIRAFLDDAQREYVKQRQDLDERFIETDLEEADNPAALS